MAAGFISEWWPASNRNGGRLHVGIPGRNKSESAFDEWTSVFGSERLTGALLDRLTHHVHILEMNGDSFRLAHSRRRSRQARSEPPPDAAPQE